MYCIARGPLSPKKQKPPARAAHRQHGSSREQHLFGGNAPIAFKAFILTLPDSVTPTEAEERYSDYRVEFGRRRALWFYPRHRHLEWMRELYDPVVVAARRHKLRTDAAEAAAVRARSGAPHTAVCQGSECSTTRLVCLLPQNLLGLAESGKLLDAVLALYPPPTEPSGSGERHPTTCVHACIHTHSQYRGMPLTHTQTHTHSGKRKFPEKTVLCLLHMPPRVTRAALDATIRREGVDGLQRVLWSPPSLVHATRYRRTAWLEFATEGAAAAARKALQGAVVQLPSMEQGIRLIERLRAPYTAQELEARDALAELGIGKPVGASSSSSGGSSGSGGGSGKAKRGKRGKRGSDSDEGADSGDDDDDAAGDDDGDEKMPQQPQDERVFASLLQWAAAPPKSGNVDGEQEYKLNVSASHTTNKLPRGSHLLCHSLSHIHNSGGVP